MIRLHKKLLGETPMVYEWGQVAMAAINSGASYYAMQEQQKAQKDMQEKSDKANAKMQSDLQSRQEKMASEQQARNDKIASDNATRAAEAAIPIGESANIDFGGQNDTLGSTIDFLVPKVGKSQLTVGSKTSGLGV